jgi:hypothetical protein
MGASTRWRVRARLSTLSARQQTAIVAIASAGLSAVVNIPRAFSYPFWQDEVGSARVIATSGPLAMARAVVRTENHPPGFYSLGWALHRLGAPVVWNRAISVLAVVALSGIVVLYARRMLPLWAAGFVGLLVALGWQFWRHGWELRPYSLFALCCLLFVIALEWAIEQPTGKRLSLLTLTVLAGALTHYFFLLTLAGAFLWLWLSWPRRALRPVYVAIGLGLVPLVLWLPAFAKQASSGGYRAYPDFALDSALESYAALFVRRDVALAPGLLVPALVLFGSLRLWRGSPTGRLCALSAVLPVAATTVIWVAGPNVYVVKNLVGAAPFAAVAIASALTALPRPVAVAATAAAAALVLALYVDSRGRIVPDYDLVAAALVQRGWTEHDPILVFGDPYQFLHPLDWYLPGGRLEVARWSGRSCERVYVVSPGGRGQALLAGAPTHRVRRIAVGRVRYRPDIAGEARRRNGHLLATRATPCARIG